MNCELLQLVQTKNKIMTSPLSFGLRMIVLFFSF